MIRRSIAELAPGKEGDRVLIVGGGTVGIYLAVELAKRGRDVLMVEAGNEQLDNFSEDTFGSVGRPHATIKIGRSRSLGGTSNLWGGQLVEYHPTDFEGRDWLPDSRWPIRYGDVARYHRETYENLGMPAQFLDDESVFRHVKTEVPQFPDGFELFLTRWMRLPSLAATYRAQLESHPKIEVLLNHTVTGITGAGTKVESLKVASADGTEHVLRGRDVVLAAGTFENVRLLLHAAETDAWSCPWRDNGNIGLFFQDHLGGRVGAVQPLDRRRFDDEVRMFLEIYNSSLGGTWGFVPLSPGEVKHMAASLKHLIVPELALVAEVDGRPVGTVFCLLDYNPRIKAINGRLFPFGFLKLLWNKRGIKRMRAISTNVVPEYQAWGVGLVLTAALVQPVLDWGMEEAEFSWVLESNHLSKRTLERGGAIVTKKYRIYQDDPPR